MAAHARSATKSPGHWLAVVVTAAGVFFSGADARADNAECLKGFEQGTAARDRGKLREARRQFVTCAADTCSKTLRVDCAKLLDDVESSLPTVVFGAKDARDADVFDVSVYVDGERVVGHDEGKAVPFDPGPHVVRFEREGSKPVEEKVLLRAGERNRHVIARFGEEEAKAEKPARKEPPPKAAATTSSVPTSSIVLGAIGLGAVGSFVFFALTGSQEKDRLQSTCAPGCADADVSSLKTSYIAADISLGVGIVALGVATYLLLTNDTPQRSARR